MIEPGDAIVFKGREYVLRVCGPQQKCFMPRDEHDQNQDVCPYQTSADITGVCNTDPADPRKARGILCW